MTAYLLDTETTGTTEPEVVQVAWWQLPDDPHEPLEGRSLNGFLRYYRPSKPIEFGALATHHIMDEDLALCEPSREFRLPEDCHYLIGHNVDFDWRAIGQPPVRRICTLALARKLWPGLDSHSLGALLYYLERDRAREWLQGAHGASVDAANGGRILAHIVGSIAVTDWQDVWRASEAARIPDVVPFGKHKGTKINELPADYRQWMLRQSDMDPYLLQAVKASL